MVRFNFERDFQHHVSACVGKSRYVEDMADHLLNTYPGRYRPLRREILEDKIEFYLSKHVPSDEWLRRSSLALRLPKGALEKFREDVRKYDEKKAKKRLIKAEAAKKKQTVQENMKNLTIDDDDDDSESDSDSDDDDDEEMDTEEAGECSLPQGKIEVN